MAGYLARCGWLDQMSAQPAEQERALQKLFEDSVGQVGKQDGPLVEESTRCQRDRIWKLWEGFCRLAKIDSARVWGDFHIQRDTATQAIQVFLTSYVRNSLQMRFVLDARERAKVRTVTHASTVVGIWRGLVAAADFYIMEPKRRAQPKKARFWRLQWFHAVEGRIAGPGFKVVAWIYEDLALKEGLLLDSPYQKVAAAPPTVRKILFTERLTG
ncbi:hypothetical protein N657DRAFT_685587 [Parathielavia appendiculata]|uniref:Uncharacterized protein n=1 Tax=Parathielavia appendiculata TaxID=2587402 RepID=A0AAN6TPW6_9PEZI|nr:hypothetical protein N657DRAFT_685587 [Parathielavia appendiculata]